MAAHVIRRTTQQRVVAVAVVGAIHVAAIATLLLALKPVWLPAAPPTGPIQLVHVRQTPPPQTPTKSNIPITLTQPGAPPLPTPPRVDIDNTPSVPPSVPGTPGRGSAAAQSVFTPASAVAGTHSTPDYPPVAARLNEQGSVRLVLSIDEWGEVANAAVIESSGFETLDASAVAWVKAHWRYEPALRDGKPVPWTTQAVVTFRLLNRQG